jgi:hypothetical protein
MYWVPASHDPDATPGREMTGHTGMNLSLEGAGAAVDTVGSMTRGEAGKPPAHHQGDPHRKTRPVVEKGY